jgi:penicillin-binding protein 1A
MDPMADAGIFSLSTLFAGAVGAVMTGPLGQVDLPDARFAEAFSRSQGYRADVFDAAGTRLGEVRSQDPLPVDLDVLPRDFIGAVMAAEDKRFTEHAGIDPFGLASAIVDTARGETRGGSGITQQMVKNTAVGPDPSYSRKVAEAVLAIRAHSHLGPREVLRLYLENAWFGRGETGAAGAARAWFGKDWSEIDLAEAAYLAALLKGPARLDALRRPEAAKARRDWIIGRMEANGWIDAERAAAAIATPLRVIPVEAAEADAADRWALAAAGWQIARDGIARDAGADMTIRLTLDPAWQRIASEALSEALERLPGKRPLARIDAASTAAALRPDGTLDGAALRRLGPDILRALPQGGGLRPALLLARRGDGWIAAIPGETDPLTLRADAFPSGYAPAPGNVVAISTADGAPDMVRVLPAVEGAVVAIDPRTGAMLASVGGADPALSAFDRTRALRQPGSAAKTFLWLAALDAGLRPDTEIPDIEQSYILPDGTLWRPRNFDRSQSGAMPMFRALERSSNLAAAALGDFVGIEAMAAMAEASGAWSEGSFLRTPAAALGTSETTLTALVAGYAAIVNDGIPRRPHVVALAEDGAGRALVDMARGLRPKDADFAQARPIASARAADDLLAMLRGVVVRGTAAAAFSDSDVTIAGKTGTSQGHRDAWFVGVTPHIAIGVWVGRDDAGPLPDGLTGGRISGPIAARILARAGESGLIDASGHRDAMLSSGSTWPPGLHEASAWAPSIGPSGFDARPPANPPPARTAEEESGWGSTSGGFWGLVEGDRNEDLRSRPEW